MLDVKVLVLKLAAIDGLASCSIAVGDIATLKDQWYIFELLQKNVLPKELYSASQQYRPTLVHYGVYYTAC